MANIDPIYTPANTRPAHRLYWSLSIFWRGDPVAPSLWLADLSQAVEKDGLRVRKHNTAPDHVEQFVIRTTPHLSPADAIRSVKGRLQTLVRPRAPRAFRRNYRIESLGLARREAVEQYVATQLGHHRMADPAVQARLGQYQVRQDGVDLSAVRCSGHGQFVSNLHLVIANEGRWTETRDAILAGMRDMLLRAGARKGHRLSRAGISTDHVHLALGCDVTESPQDVALGYMNNLAYVHGMKPVFQFGYYVGTFGEYDFGATR